MVELCRRYPNTFLLDDEAHGLGVLGARGRGAAEHYGVLDTVDLITITFSKTLGSCGGALIGIAPTPSSCSPSTPTRSSSPRRTRPARWPPRSRRCASCAAAPEMTEQLRDNVDRFVGLLTERGVPVNPAESAIITIPLRQRDEVSAVVLARELLDAGVFVNPVVAPAVPRGLGLIRLSLMLDHTPALLEEAAETIYKVLNDADQLPEDA